MYNITNFGPTKDLYGSDGKRIYNYSNGTYTRIAEGADNYGPQVKAQVEKRQAGITQGKKVLEQELKNIGLDDLYESNKEGWNKLFNASSFVAAPANYDLSTCDESCMSGCMRSSSPGTVDECFATKCNCYFSAVQQEKLCTPLCKMHCLAVPGNSDQIKECLYSDCQCKADPSLQSFFNMDMNMDTEFPGQMGEQLEDSMQEAQDEAQDNLDNLEGQLNDAGFQQEGTSFFQTIPVEEDIPVASIVISFSVLAVALLAVYIVMVRKEQRIKREASKLGGYAEKYSFLETQVVSLRQI